MRFSSRRCTLAPGDPSYARFRRRCFASRMSSPTRMDCESTKRSPTNTVSSCWNVSVLDNFLLDIKFLMIHRQPIIDGLDASDVIACGYSRGCGASKQQDVVFSDEHCTGCVDNGVVGNLLSGMQLLLSRVIHGKGDFFRL